MRYHMLIIVGLSILTFRISSLQFISGEYMDCLRQNLSSLMKNYRKNSLICAVIKTIYLKGHQLPLSYPTLYAGNLITNFIVSPRKASVLILDMQTILLFPAMLK